MRNFLALTLIFLSLSLMAQDNVGVGTLTPNPNAALDIESNDKGLLIPRLDAAQRAAIVGLTNVESGLLVFDQTDNLFYYWDGSAWLPMPIDLDEQDIDSVVLTGSILEVFISNGNSATVDLAPLAAIGPAGPPGADGADGIDGADGADGVDGADGAPGPAGPPGADGADGVDGAPGPAGPPGADGADGVDGAPGPAGPPGADGADGAPGPAGPPGADGADGAPGPAGPPGPAGSDDQNLTSAILTGNILEINIENGSSVNVDLSSLSTSGGTDDQNIQGSGLAGNILTIGIEGGTSETIDLSSLAGIDGADGVDGADGAPGPAGPPGADGADGVDGADGADGAPGPAGPPGADGADGTDGIDGADGAPGPAGPPGADGVDGAPGPAGPPGPAGSDDQNIQGSGLAGTTLTIGIEGGTSETIDLSSLVSDDWALLGNSGTDENTNYLGTNDNQDLVFRTNGIENMRINTNGNIGIGTSSDIARLYLSVPNTDSVTSYGIFNTNNSAANGIKYGIYTITNSDGTGGRFGIRNSVTMNSASNSTGYGIRNSLNSYGTGLHCSSYNLLQHFGDSVSTRNYASYNNLLVSTSSNTSTNYGEYTKVDYSAGTRYGEYKEMRTNSIATGTIYGDYNLIENDGDDIIYGMYSDITNTGAGAHYGLYSDVPGGSNDYAAFFNSGNVVMNEVGEVYNVRIETDTREYALFVDAEDDLVRIGTNFGFAQGQTNNNGDSVNNILVDYVIDMDVGASTGTAIGIGSIEYLLDASSLTTINNNFAPSTDNIRDLGSSALRWDDVYATNGVIQTSDRTEKESIQSLTYGLNDLLKLNPVSFKWNKTHIGITPISSAEKEMKLGFIAQEVMEVLPEIVQTHNWMPISEDRPGEFTLEPMPLLGMSYHEFTPVIVKAIQEQQEIIESLKTELKEVKALLKQNGIK